jgi:hypothetical protein
MSVTKQSFGLLIATMTHWWGPTTIRISGDASVADQIRKAPDGLVEFSFPERMVMIANHQVRPEYLHTTPIPGPRPGTPGPCRAVPPAARRLPVPP